MTEKLLHFIWQFQYFNKSELATVDGESIFILTAGSINHNQGPDFQNAKIFFSSTTWAGSIELHVKTSDWNKHNHSGDKNYKNVILHVVWEHDETTNGLHQTPGSIPVLELQNKVSKILLQRYEELMNASSFIPCQHSLKLVREVIWQAWKERLLIERMTRRSITISHLFEESTHHWEETFWWLLARNFGIRVNALSFEAIAKSIPLTIIAKHKQQLLQLESLLLGQAGLLDKNFKEKYPALLQKEYYFLQHKYQLKQIHASVHFLRMRPGNFPTIRLAQLAALLYSSTHLFSKIKETDELDEVKTYFAVTANDYWHYHYKFDEETAFRKKNLGSAMIENIIINTVVPVLFAYGDYLGDESYKLKALKWLEEISSESNPITKGFELFNIENKSAYDSQSLIELKNEYCNNRRCLECAIGNSLLNTGAI